MQADLFQEASALRASIVQVESKLAKAELQIAAFASIVDNQAEHLRQLREGQQIVSLDEYREMKIKHHKHGDALSEAKLSVSVTKGDLRDRKKHLADLEVQLAKLKLTSDNKVLPFRSQK